MRSTSRRLLHRGGFAFVVLLAGACGSPTADSGKARTLDANDWPTEITVGEPVSFGVTLTYADGDDRWRVGVPAWSWTVSDTTVAGLTALATGYAGHNLPDVTHASASVFGLRPGTIELSVEVPAAAGYQSRKLTRKIAVKANPYACAPLEFSGDHVEANVSDLSCRVSASAWADTYRLPALAPGLYELTVNGGAFTIRDTDGVPLAVIGSGPTGTAVALGAGPYLLQTPQMQTNASQVVYSVHIAPLSSDSICATWLLPGASVTQPQGYCLHQVMLPPMRPMRLSIHAARALADSEWTTGCCQDLMNDVFPRLLSSTKTETGLDVVYELGSSVRFYWPAPTVRVPRGPGTTVSYTYKSPR